MDDRLEVLLDALQAAQAEFHAGGSECRLRDLLAQDVTWHVPGANAIAGDYEGVDEVLGYFARRRELASGTLRLHRKDILTGQGATVAALTDGTARIDGSAHRWSTVGLYRFREGLLVECWLLPLDTTQFDRIWAE